jgi:cytochrome c-type biogenesis protein
MTVIQHISWSAAFLAFGGGLVSFFSPCVAPLVPAYLGYLAGTVRTPSTAVEPSSEGVPIRRRVLLRVSLLFMSGFSLAFVGLGLLAASFGSLIVAYRPVVETLAGAVMLVMGAFLLGLLPRDWSNVLMREARIHLRPHLRESLGVAGPFALGGLFAAGWTPCIGPVLAALLVYVGAAANLGQAALLLGVYALGFAVPFVAIGLGWSAGLSSLRWAKAHGHALSLATGVGLVLVGLLYVSGQAQAFAIWAQRYTPTPFH